MGGLIWSSAIDPARQDQLTTGPGTPPLVQSSSTPSQVAFAKYLTESGVVQYSAYWCPHCHEQKEMFGKEAASKLRIVECASDGMNNERELCESKGIEGYPTWEINGRLYSGIKQLKELAELTGYQFYSD